VVLGLLGGAGWFARQRTNKAEEPKVATQSTAKKTVQPEKEVASEPENNEGYLVVQDWGVRFKIPSTLTSVEYRVYGEKVVLYAKPAGYTVTYRADYEKVSADNFAQYALGTLYRSTEAVMSANNPKETAGKKLGNYYYYTAHAFSSLATGAGTTGLYFTPTCDQDSRNSADCDMFMQAESKAFQAMNQGDTALLNTIEPTK
jgi:hypothetical protein